MVWPLQFPSRVSSQSCLIGNLHQTTGQCAHQFFSNEEEEEDEEDEDEEEEDNKKKKKKEKKKKKKMMMMKKKKKEKIFLWDLHVRGLSGYPTT